MWGGANLKIVCTQNLIPPRNSGATFLPPRILRTEILSPPLPIGAIFKHVNLLLSPLFTPPPAVNNDHSLREI